ncbi:MAG: cohesin domain-containing protein [bacterium]
MRALLTSLRNGYRTFLLAYRSWGRRRRLLFWVTLAIIGILATPTILSLPASFTPSGEAGFYFVMPSQANVGTAFPLELHVKTGKRAINAISATLHFDTRYLQVTNMTTAASFCSFYTGNAFDNIKGEIRISCGAPSPGFTGDSSILLINITSHNVGSTSFSLQNDTAQILANDGKGTQLYKGTLPKQDLLIRQSL